MSPHPPRRHGLRAALVALGVVVAVLAMHGLSLHHLEHLGQGEHASHASHQGQASSSSGDDDALSAVDLTCVAGSCVALLLGGLLLGLRRRGALRLPRGDRGAPRARRVITRTAARPPPGPRRHLVLSVQRC